MPFPVPGLPDVTRSHAELLVADHGHVVGATTAKLPVAPTLLKDALLGEISIVQGSRASSRTDTDRPAIVSVTVRTVSVGFAVTLTLTAPFPVPVAPLAIVIQPLSDAAVHVQWLAAVTVTEFDPPAAANDSEEVERV